jgi:hypothetical protein
MEMQDPGCVAGHAVQQKAVMRRMSSSAAPVLTSTVPVAQRAVGAPQVSLLRDIRREGAMLAGGIPQQVGVLAPHAEEEDVRLPLSIALSHYACECLFNELRCTPASM